MDSQTPAERLDTLSVLSLVLAIGAFMTVWCCIGYPIGLIAVVLGAVALSRNSSGGYSGTSRVLAISGIAITAFAIFLHVILIAVGQVSKPELPGSEKATTTGVPAVHAPTATAPEAPISPVPEAPQLPPEPAAGGFVARVIVYPRTDGSTWDAGSSAKNAPDIELTVSVGTDKENSKTHQDTAMFEENRVGALLSGVEIAVSVEDRDYGTDAIGKGTGTYVGEPLWIVAGQSVVELLDPAAVADHPFATFQAEADARFDADFSAQADAALAGATAAATAKDWAGCQAALRWFGRHRPRPGAAPLASVAAAEKLATTVQGKLAAEKAAASKARLAARAFTKVGADQLVETALFNSSFEEKWDKNYAGKYVRWSAKWIDDVFIGVGQLEVGASARVRCSAWDESFDDELAKHLVKWDRVTLEGRLTTISKQAGDPRANISMDECIVRK